MGRWTPNTSEVREDYEGGPAAFDRWLAAHDAEVRKEALEEAATSLKDEAERLSGLRALQPGYRAALVETTENAESIVRALGEAH